MATLVRTQYVQWFSEMGRDDVDKVGGKNASLGEMFQNLESQGVRIPNGFATTADAYRHFIKYNKLENRITEHMEKYNEGDASLSATGKAIRKLIEKGEFPDDLKASIMEHYADLCRKYGKKHVDVAVRSSATAEDLPDASFAGQQETFLNISGEEALLNACRECYASLFTDRAISYRQEKGFSHKEVALSIGVQKMVRADKAGSGVMFTLDTETGFPKVVLINATWGLGENIVQGAVNPDEYLVYKPFINHDGVTPIIEKTVGAKHIKMVYNGGSGKEKSTKNVETTAKEQQALVLSDDEIMTLARWATLIEDHYGIPMDIEWAKDGQDEKLYIVQARPETVQSRKAQGVMESYRMKEKGKVLVEGISIGSAIAAGKVKCLKSIRDAESFEDGDILVTEMTDPDWVPLMKKAAGIVTNRGGRTCHAAIVSREFGIPAIVGTGNAFDVLKEGQDVTLSCAEGNEGFVYDGILEFEVTKENLGDLPEIGTKLMMNIASPAAAFRWWQVPVDGIGLARMEFIINNIIQIHPMALVHFDDLEDKKAKQKIEELTAGFENKPDYFVDRLSRGIAKIAASVYPAPVIVRMSDFKTNEYAELIGGSQFEGEEANPMLGFRGAARYKDERYEEAFLLECKALKMAREQLGFDNIIAMIPFCRTLDEADGVIELMATHGLARGQNGLEIYMMCEIPANILLAEEFMKRFDGFSIGSNDLTQLVLGVDRDSNVLADIFDERDPAVKKAIRMLFEVARKQNNFKIGICGQAPSDYPDFAVFLMEEGIDSISLNPDSIIEVQRRLGEQAQWEKQLPE